MLLRVYDFMFYTTFRFNLFTFSLFTLNLFTLNPFTLNLFTHNYFALTFSHLLSVKFERRYPSKCTFRIMFSTQWTSPSKVSDGNDLKQRVNTQKKIKKLADRWVEASTASMTIFPESSLRVSWPTPFLMGT